MNYKEWKKSFVDGGSKDDLTSVVSDGTMTDIDKKAILDYMSAKSYILNEKLRTGVTLSDDEQEFMAKLDVALSKMPTYEGNLQRSLFFYSDEDVKLFLEEYKKGNTLKYNEFIRLRRVRFIIRTVKFRCIYKTPRRAKIYLR